VWPAPAFSPGDIVVIDDLDSHKSPEIRKAIREHMDELAIAKRLLADMVGQERDAKAGSRSHAHGREIAAAHAWFVAHYLAHAVLALKVPRQLDEHQQKLLSLPHFL
jgi:hypothetical protein